MHPLLRRVSRSFYLTIRVLPPAIRPQVGTAYLLARTTDTIADTPLIPIAERKQALAGLRDAIVAASEGRTEPVPDFGEFAASAETQGTPAERSLLRDVGNILVTLRRFGAEDRCRIRDVLVTITSGQRADLDRFGGAGPENIAALADDGALEEYTYRVAGCVGEFWTRMCRAHLFPRAALDDGFLVEKGIRFGKGLQFVNLLRDLPRDLRMGRCYIPLRELSEIGLRPESLLEPTSMGSFRGLYDRYLDRAVSYLADGWEYTNALPRQQARVRLACAWPILIGVRTVARLRGANVLDGAQRVKISRREIRATVFESIGRYPFSAAWRRLFAEHGGKSA